MPGGIRVRFGAVPGAFALCTALLMAAAFAVGVALDILAIGLALDDRRD
jgi:hypothetical protein